MIFCILLGSRENRQILHLVLYVLYEFKTRFGWTINIYYTYNILYIYIYMDIQTNTARKFEFSTSNNF